MDFTGLILAGGKSTRFGLNKIKARIGDIPLVVSQVFKSSFFCNEILISSSVENYKINRSIIRNIETYRTGMGAILKTDTPVPSIILDEKFFDLKNSGTGPLAGIYTGLSQAKNDYCLVLASDMPFISYRLLKLLTDEAARYMTDAVIIKNEKGIESLCGIYSRKCIKIIETNIKKSRFKISETLEQLDVHFIGTEQLDRQGIGVLDFYNINTRKDLKIFNRIWFRGVTGNGAIHMRGGNAKKWQDFFYRGAGKGI